MNAPSPINSPSTAAPLLQIRFCFSFKYLRSLTYCIPTLDNRSSQLTSSSTPTLNIKQKMRFFTPLLSLYILTVTASPLPTTSTSSVQTYSSQKVISILPQLQQLLQNHPNIEANIALQNPVFASKDNAKALDYGKLLVAANGLDDPNSSAASALTSALGSFLGYLPGAITGGVGSILSGEWALISTIFKGLCLGLCG
jgi:hypothetical protein